ncbi:MAG: hypothetical protein ACKVH9_09575, partial [Rhodobacterales bacterium]
SDVPGKKNRSSQRSSTKKQIRRCERDIQESLRRLGTGRSVITIAHRLSTVVDADKIVVLEKGVVVEEGTHDDLLKHNGRYAHMWHMQETEVDAV